MTGVTHRLSIVAVGTVLGLIVGCDGGGGGALPTAYVDVGNTGAEDGSRAHPYNTIGEAIAAVDEGGTVVVAAGTYNVSQDVNVPRVMTIQGAGSDKTIVTHGFLVSAPAAATAVTVKGIDCKLVHFSSDQPAPPRIVVTQCKLDEVHVTYPPNHAYTIEDSTIRGDVVFGHGDCTSATHVVRRCQVAGQISFAHGAGPVTNTVEDCTVGSEVAFKHGDGAATNTVKNCQVPLIALKMGSGSTNVISGNTISGESASEDGVSGIIDSSGHCHTTISGNTLAVGSIVDKSGGTGEGIEDEIIEDNTVQHGAIISKGASVTIRDNTVTVTSLDQFDPDETSWAGILVKSGNPTNVIGNTITVPSGSAWDPTSDDEPSVCGILTLAGPGVIRDNSVTGGVCGLFDKSGATEVSGNTFTQTQVGAYSKGAGAFTNNTITGCTGDGMILWCLGPITGNTVTDNGGAGIRLMAPIDLGGGATGGLGGNTIKGNGDYDLRVECLAETAATVFAEHNLWDHSTQADVDQYDVYDGKDDATLSTVDFLPQGTVQP